MIYTAKAERESSSILAQSAVVGFIQMFREQRRAVRVSKLDVIALLTIRLSHRRLKYSIQAKQRDKWRCHHEHRNRFLRVGRSGDHGTEQSRRNGEGVSLGEQKLFSPHTLPADGKRFHLRCAYLVPYSYRSVPGRRGETSSCIDCKMVE